MAMIGRRNFGNEVRPMDDASTIDTSDKLLEFAVITKVETSPLDVYGLSQGLRYYY